VVHAVVGEGPDLGEVGQRQLGARKHRTRLFACAEHRG
jgi:hypothetical protein